MSNFPIEEQFNAEAEETVGCRSISPTPQTQGTSQSSPATGQSNCTYLLTAAAASVAANAANATMENDDDNTQNNAFNMPPPACDGNTNNAEVQPTAT
jgi:hypothetical protein